MSKGRYQRLQFKYKINGFYTYLSFDEVRHRDDWDSGYLLPPVVYNGRLQGCLHARNPMHCPSMYIQIRTFAAFRKPRSIPLKWVEKKWVPLISRLIFFPLDGSRFIQVLLILSQRETHCLGWAGKVVAAFSGKEIRKKKTKHMHTLVTIAFQLVRGFVNGLYRSEAVAILFFFAFEVTFFLKQRSALEFLHNAWTAV